MTELYEARRAYHQDDYARARQLFEEVGEAGDARGWCALAVMWSAGEGGPADPAEAARLYERAAQAGIAEAAYNLGALYATGKGVRRDMARALEWYLQAGQLGDPDGDFMAGVIHANGQGVAKSPSLACQAWERAAAQRQGQAMLHLGHLCLDAEAGTADVVAAAEWYLRAGLAGVEEAGRHVADLLDTLEAQAKSGSAQAQFLAGQAYRLGIGTEADPGRAAAWYERAAGADHAGALKCLGDLVREAKGVPRDERRMAELYQRAAELGDAGAQHNIAFMHLQGIVFPTDRDQAIAWYRRAAQQGAADSKADLARLLLDRQAPGDDVEAFACLGKAAAQGHAGAMISLGLAYRDGRGVARDLVQAARWFFMALGKGLGDGAHHLHGFARQMTPEQVRTADRLAGGDGSWAAATVEAFLSHGEDAT